jgi:hypothetical protein
MRLSELVNSAAQVEVQHGPLKIKLTCYPHKWTPQFQDDIEGKVAERKRDSDTLAIVALTEKWDLQGDDEQVISLEYAAVHSLPLGLRRAIIREIVRENANPSSSAE